MKTTTMSFTFTGLENADKLRRELVRLKLPGTLAFVRGRWAVETNTSALAHAGALIKFIGGGKHPGVRHGQCEHCGHYGDDCKGRK